MFSAILNEVLPQLKAGAFLVSGDSKAGKNPMTIGWAQFGIVWGKPICTVFVRKSRYSHELMEKNKVFEVVVPKKNTMQAELGFCGTKSGRDTDKSGQLTENSPIFAKFICNRVAKTEMNMSEVDKEILERFYNTNQATSDGDPHTIYFGEIISVEKY